MGHTYIVASLNDETYKCFINVLDAKTTISVGHWERDYYFGEKDLLKWENNRLQLPILKKSLYSQ